MSTNIIRQFTLNCLLILLAACAVGSAVAEANLQNGVPVDAVSLKLCQVALKGEQFPVAPALQEYKDHPPMSVWEGRGLPAGNVVAQADAVGEDCPVSAS